MSADHKTMSVCMYYACGIDEGSDWLACAPPIVYVRVPCMWTWNWWRQWLTSLCPSHCTLYPLTSLAVSVFNCKDGHSWDVDSFAALQHALSKRATNQRFPCIQKHILNRSRTKPNQTRANQIKPNQNQTKPSQTKPKQNKPGQPNQNQTKPCQIKTHKRLKTNAF